MPTLDWLDRGIALSEGFEGVFQLVAVGVLAARILTVDGLASVGMKCVNLRVCGSSVETRA